MRGCIDGVRNLTSSWRDDTVAYSSFAVYTSAPNGFSPSCPA